MKRRNIEVTSIYIEVSSSTAAFAAQSTKSGKVKKYLKKISTESMEHSRVVLEEEECKIMEVEDMVEY